MKKTLLVVAVISLIAAGWYIFFSSGLSVIKVNGVQAAFGDITIKIELTGEVSPFKSYSVMSFLSGRINDIYVKEGDAVEVNDRLLTLDESAAAIALNQTSPVSAQSGGGESLTAVNYGEALSRAQIALALSQTTGIDYDSFNEAFGGEISKKAEAAYSTLSSLVPPDSVNTSVYPSAGSYDKGSSKTYASSYNALESELTQKSAMNGKVIRIYVNKGEILAAGAPAMTIADDSRLKILCYVNENDMKRIKSDLKVNIITRVDNILYGGKITGKSLAAAKPQAGGIGSEALGEVYITPPDNFNELIGSSVDIEIILNEAKDVLCLPVECISPDGYVFVINKDNELEKRLVKTGITDGYKIQIIEGVANGENVAADPQGLSEKRKVKIVD